MKAYVREGARVVVNSRSAEDCASESIAALGGTVDMLVDNADQPRVAPSESLPEADYRYTLDLTMNGCFVLTQEIVHGMLAAGSGASST